MKRFFLAISLMSILNMVALIGLIGFAWNKGYATPERVRKAIAALKGEDGSQDVASQPSEEDKLEVGLASEAQIQRDNEADDRLRIELARREKEIENAWAQLQLQSLELVRKQEAFEAEKRRFADERERIAKREGDSGIQAEIDTLSGIDAKSAKELLRLKDDADVVRILKAMDDRKRNKIVKACKTNEERLWIGRILEQFHNGTAAQTEDLGAGS